MTDKAQQAREAAQQKAAAAAALAMIAQQNEAATGQPAAPAPVATGPQEPLQAAQPLQAAKPLQAAQPPQDAPKPAREGKGAPKAEKAPKAPKIAPWADAHPKVTQSVLLRLPERLHQQLMWAKDERLIVSLQNAALAQLEALAAKLIKEHWKP